MDQKSMEQEHYRLQRRAEDAGSSLAGENEPMLGAKALHSRLQMVFERIPILIAMADASGALVTLNPAGRAMLGWGAQEGLSGMTLVDCHAPDARARIMREALPGAARDGVWAGDSVLLARDGREIKVSQVVIAARGQDGALDGFSVVESDMTEWVRGEEALRKSEAELRRISAEHLTIQESERQRIAADLHDGLGQSLSLVKLTLENAAAHLAAGSFDEAGATLQKLIPRVKEAMGEVRRISMDLRPSTLDDLGILPTLSWFFREFSAACPQIRVETEIDAPESDVPAPLKLAIYRILQEAMSNIVKHAKADHVHVRLSTAGDALHLSIQDNGIGFDLAAVASRDRLHSGLGLRSMKERAELCGGVHAIESDIGHGTLLRISWPLERPHGK